MKVAIIGTRGIPAKYGGFETFAQELAPRLVEKGLEVEVYCPPTPDGPEKYKGVTLRYLPVSKDDKPLHYYICSVKTAVKTKADVLICCGANGYALLPYLFKKKRPCFITNTDGIESRRSKWNWVVRKGTKIVGETLAVIFSDRLIADSKGIRDYLTKEYWYVPNKTIDIIEYGSYIPGISPKDLSLIEQYGVKGGDYYLVVSRLEPENNVHMILEGYRLSNTSKPLLVVGNLKKTPYVEKLVAENQHPNIHFVGGVYEPQVLQALRSHCSAYFHGHSVGGTNPSLLEAMGSGNIVIAHDNPFTREVTDNEMFYFSSPKECAEQIHRVEGLTSSQREELHKKAIDRIRHYYNWERITSEYYRVLTSLNSQKN